MYRMRYGILSIVFLKERRCPVGIKIIVDSSADLPKEIIDRYGFIVIPLSVHFGSHTYLDSVDLTPGMFYEKLIISGEMPTTSQIPPERFVTYFKKELDEGHQIICITLGSNASGTCQSAYLAREELKKEDITIIDSNCLCSGVAYIAIEVARMVESNRSIEEILTAIEPLTNNGIEHLFCVDTLEYLKKGGRIKASKAAVAEILNIKPILNVENALTQIIHKVRGRKKIIPYYLERMKKDLDYESDRIMVAHAQDLEFAKQLIEKIRSDLNWDKEIIVSEVGATIGTHAGPGVLACFYKKK